MYNYYVWFLVNETWQTTDSTQQGKHIMCSAISAVGLSLYEFPLLVLLYFLYSRLWTANENTLIF